MSDLIQLLPDSVANQIAAGEVVQRPASAVKELLENTIDAGATNIKLIIKESGKTLIQVVDDGCGMSERDARICFERHATSKIRSAGDLFAIRTLGFRGEALASIASVAQVELKTRRTEDEVGTSVVIEGTEFKGQTPVQCPAGTSISVKNLFYNVPARRNFLKSNTLELKHIIDEFFRVTLVNPGIAFTFYNQDKILHQLPSSNLKQRIINLFGNSYGQKLIPLSQKTDLVDISGFIGKPEYAKKSRGEQFFFTNGRYMKSPYLHHAVESAFKELIPTDAIPSYFIYLQVDPKTIDINIHPTKTEINFQEIKSIYTLLFTAVKQAIGTFNLAPSIDFNPEQGLNIPPLPTGYLPNPPTITINPDYNPFEKRSDQHFSRQRPEMPSANTLGWEKLYEPLPKENVGEKLNLPISEQKRAIQIKNGWIVTHTASGILIIDQQYAHERILYERFLEPRTTHQPVSQKLLLPHTLQLSPDDAHVLLEWLAALTDLGFDIAEFGRNTFLVHAMPQAAGSTPPDELIQSLIESLKTPDQEAKGKPDTLIAKSLAKKMAVRRGKRLLQEEVDMIVEGLLACRVPDLSPDGKPTLMVIPFDEINKKFKYT